MLIRANALVVMAKAPIPGSVKTRLMPVFSAPQAAALARALLVDQLEHLRAFRNADLYLAFTPLGARRSIRRLTPTRFEIFPQRGVGLGARMQNSFATLFAKGYKRIVLIGGDLPPVPLTDLAQAFADLDHPRPSAVLGPSLDGGYYLIGLNRDQPALFHRMIWSHDRVFAQTLEKLEVSGVRSKQLRPWFDVDTIDDVRRLLLLRGPSTKAMKNTLSLLDRRPIARSPSPPHKSPRSVSEFTAHGCTLSSNVRSFKSGR
jgi:rSAM/selenodomain-associated transferase 1